MNYGHLKSLHFLVYFPPQLREMSTIVSLKLETGSQNYNSPLHWLSTFCTPTPNNLTDQVLIFFNLKTQYEVLNIFPSLQSHLVTELDLNVGNLIAEPICNEFPLLFHVHLIFSILHTLTAIAPS
jgi:hypothetical protein